MICRLCRIASALSLVLGAVTLLLWVGSYWGNISIELARGGQVYELGASRGLLIASNVPQRRMEAALLQQRVVAQVQAAFRYNDACNESGVWNLPREDPPARAVERMIRRREKADAEAVLDGLAHLCLPPISPTAPWSSACHCRTVAALAGLPWFAIASAGTGIRLIRVRRRRRGLCPTCGYDLRASKDRCPECGTPIAKIAETATIARSVPGN